MRSEEFIKEAGILSKIGNALKPTAKIGFGYEKPDYPGSTGRATGVLGRLASDLVGPENYAATAQALGATGRPKNAAIQDLAKDTAAQIRSNPNLAAQMVNEPTTASADPNTALTGKQLPTSVQLPSGKEAIKYQNKVFVLNDNGEWTYFGSNKAVPKDLQDEFDAVIGFDPAKGPTKQQSATPQTMPSATSQTQNVEPPTTAPAAAQTQAKPTIRRMTDGGILITDKMGKQWTKPANGDYWSNEQGAIFRPGSPEYQKLSDFNQGLRESLGRKRR